MSITTCPTCRSTTEWSWVEAFEKFGFEDGDGLVMTEHVAAALRTHGYTVEIEPWGCHNVTIRSIKTKRQKELIPEGINYGYDDPREYLPMHIVKLLDNAFPELQEVMV